MTLGHLLGIDQLGRTGIEEILDLAEAFEEVSGRQIPTVPALRGRTVALMFFEDSTRTRLSFDTAAKRLSAQTLVFSAAGSSLSKGESLKDTFATVDAMGVDAMVVRHGCAGVPATATRWTTAPVLNAGDGRHEHPTQALLDCYTVTRHLGTPALDGLRVGIVGDVANSRVARSDVAAFTALGASVTLVGPPTLLPPSVAGWPVDVSHDLDEVLGDLDVVYLLRLQTERMASNALPSVREYAQRYGLDRSRSARLKPGAVVMHPGPMNRGVEISPDVADGPRSLVLDQVAKGVAVRMAVLFLLLGSPASEPRSLGTAPRSSGSVGHWPEPVAEGARDARQGATSG